MNKMDKPMLAPNDPFNQEDCRLPKMGSAKIDGFRMFNQGGTAYTRSGKPMANEYTQALFSKLAFDGLDGELVVGNPSDPNVFNNSQGPLRAKGGMPRAVWYIFDDRTDMRLPFGLRFAIAQKRVKQLKRDMGGYADLLEIVDHTLFYDMESILRFESDTVHNGYEGIMLRDPEGKYKTGRATYRENTFLKVKRLVHEEGTIVGFEEQMENTNPSFTDELGRTKRSQNAAGLVPSGMVGAFWIENEKWPERFKVSCSAMTDDQKREAFEKFDALYADKIGAYKYFGHGSINAPRQGVFKGLRSDLDISED